MGPEMWDKWEDETAELGRFGTSNFPNRIFAFNEECVTFLAIQYIAQKEPHVCEAVDLAFSEWKDIADIECLLEYVRAIMEHEELLAGKDGEEPAEITERSARGY